jgi:uncharacterized protein involved in type VI secretion and phage assembly
MITAEEVLQNITEYGLEFYRIYPGLYRAIVTRNDDPETRGRIQAHVASMQSEAPDIWIKPAFSGAGKNRGLFWPPEVGDSVFVSFYNGNPSRPELYIGGWFGYPDDATEVPSELGYSSDKPDIRGIVTRMGHVLLFRDEPGNEGVELIWNKPNTGDEALSDDSKTATRPGSASQGGGTASLKFESDGSIQVTDNATPNQKIRLDATSKEITIEDAYGNKVTLGASGVTIKGTVVKVGENAVEPSVKGQSWLAWEAGHVHSTPVGPSGPPTVAPTTALLTTVAKVE